MQQQAFWLELEREAKSARAAIERLPQAHLDWRPHPKSKTLAELAWHMASIPGVVTGMVQHPEQDRAKVHWPPRPDNAPAMLTGLNESIAKAKANLVSLDDSTIVLPFRVTLDGRELISTTRAGFLRWAMLTHFVHHRAQLGLYLRLLNVPVPALVGPSADENPFLPKS